MTMRIHPVSALNVYFRGESGPKNQPGDRQNLDNLVDEGRRALARVMSEGRPLPDPPALRDYVAPVFPGSDSPKE